MGLRVPTCECSDPLDFDLYHLYHKSTKKLRNLLINQKPDELNT